MVPRQGQTRVPATRVHLEVTRQLITEIHRECIVINQECTTIMEIVAREAIMIQDQAEPDLNYPIHKAISITIARYLVHISC